MTTLPSTQRVTETEPPARCYPDSQSSHYLGAIRKRLEQLYDEHPNDPALREQLSDEVDWIDATLNSSDAKVRPSV